MGDAAFLESARLQPVGALQAGLKPQRRRRSYHALVHATPARVATVHDVQVFDARGLGFVVLGAEYKAGPVTYLAPTPRMVEVLAMPRTLATLRQLVLEKPRGACAVCWRDQYHDSLANDLLACSRSLRGTARCSAFIRQIRAAFLKRSEKAKASFLAELEVAHVG